MWCGVVNSNAGGGVTLAASAEGFNVSFFKQNRQNIPKSDRQRRCRYGILCKKHTDRPDDEHTDRSDATVRWAECLCGREVELRLGGACQIPTVEDDRADKPDESVLNFARDCECGRTVQLEIYIVPFEER